jgi:hypothetical protein
MGARTGPVRKGRRMAGQHKRELSKSKFSMYLRTMCDRELYLSLFSNNPSALGAAGFPIPLKSRPGVQLITTSGREFEYQQFDFLISSIPNHVVHKANGHANVDLGPGLKGLKGPIFILQPQIEPEEFRDAGFKSLGVSDQESKDIPELSGQRPDGFYVSPLGTAEYEVLPDGSRIRVAADDPRQPIKKWD